MPDADSILWWGYRHTNGTLQAKRYFGREDIKEAAESDFVDDYYGPFECNGREEALKILKKEIGSNPPS